MIDDEAFEIPGDTPLADAFGYRAAFRFELAMLVIVVQCGPHRIGEADRHVPLLFLQIHRDAGERAARADGADEAIDRAIGLLPDPGAGRTVMAFAIGYVLERVGPDTDVRRRRRPFFLTPQL